MTTKSRDTRRPKVPFTKEEEENLRYGVSKLGRFWTQILNTYSFHPSRTSVDLKDKFRNLVGNSDRSDKSEEYLQRNVISKLMLLSCMTMSNEIHVHSASSPRNSMFSRIQI